MDEYRISAFSRGSEGGNPAGVVIARCLPNAERMQDIARDIGCSETVFAARQGKKWDVRYYAPEGEVAFCGHATIALGAVFGEKFGSGDYSLNLAKSQISVAVSKTTEGWAASLQSPPTHSAPLERSVLDTLKGLFGLVDDDLDVRLPPRLAHAGNNHAILALRDREKLATMSYPFVQTAEVMAAHELTTISLLYIESDRCFISRNAFAIGGVVEDAATGAAAAALGGALVDLGWPAVQGGGSFMIMQGDDMGQPSTLKVAVTGRSGDSVQVSGLARML